MNSYKATLSLFFAISSFALAPSAATAAERGWNLQRTWVFVVGILEFKQKDVFSSFPPANRRDTQLVQYFRNKGVPPSQITALYDEKATQNAISTSLTKLLRRAAPGDTFFLYYTGHGYRDGGGVSFAAHDTGEAGVPGWSARSILPTIEKNFKGSRAFLAIDCCNSGYLADLVTQSRGRIGYACVTSSSAREASTGHWTFTDCLLDALRGAPYVDLDRNGAISLAEFASHARTEMAVAEEQRTSFSTTAGFAPGTVLARAKTQPKAPIGQRVKAKQNGTWYAGRIVAIKGKQVQVSYIGYDEPAEWFNKDDSRNIRRITTPPTFPVGTKVEVKWQGDWYAAVVLKAENGVHYIHYIEDDSSWDEWVPTKRIRLPKK